MLFIPKKFKFKKHRKGKVFNRILVSSPSLYKLSLGTIGLKALSANRINSKQLDAMRQSINKIIKKTGKLIIHAFPNVPVSKKPIEVRMGKGKGVVDHWVFKIKPGFIICEIITDNKEIAVKALTVISKKLNLKTKIVLN